MAEWVRRDVEILEVFTQYYQELYTSGNQQGQVQDETHIKL